MKLFWQYYGHSHLGNFTQGTRLAIFSPIFLRRRHQSGPVQDDQHFDHNVCGKQTLDMQTPSVFTHAKQ